MKKEHIEMWKKCAEFHGHECGGLAIGFQASLYAMELLGVKQRAGDEELACVVENDACGVDAVQALLGCTLGKGNLILRVRGKQAFDFYDRKSGAALRLVLRATPEKSREERRAWLMDGDYHDMFDVKAPVMPLPEPAKIFKTCTCSVCGESMSECNARLVNGQTVCEDCWPDYRRVF